MDIVVSAPGKVILCGEHAVVYGKSAIAASLNLRSYVHLLRTNDGNITVELQAIGLKQCWAISQLQSVAEKNKVDIENPSDQSDDLVKNIKEMLCKDMEDSSTKFQASLAFLYMYIAICSRDGSLPSLNVKVTSKLPVGAGLGSSASFSVCLAAALLLDQGLVTAPEADDNGVKQWKKEDLDLVNKWAYQGERIIHGNPSGIDNSVAVFGGAIKFQAGKITKIKKIPQLRILLTSTNVPRSTKALVSAVRERYNRLPDVMQSILDAIENISEQCEKLFETMVSNSQRSPELEYTTLEELIDINQHLLQAIGVSHVTLDKICHVTSKYRLHSKLTGAGGGGCAFSVLRPDTQDSVLSQVMRELEDEGFHCFSTEVGSFGVMVHDSASDCGS